MSENSILVFKGMCFVLLLFCIDRLISLVSLRGLDNYFSFGQPAKILLIGHSQTVLGLDKVRMERELGCPVAKVALDGANTADRLALIRYYFSRQPDSVEVVVYDVSAHTFTGEGLSSNSYRLLFPFMENAEVRKFIRQHSKSWSEYWVRVFFSSPRFNETTLALAVRGYLHYWGNLKMGTVDLDRLKNELHQGRFRRIKFDHDNIDVFKETIAFVRGQGRKMVLIFMPSVDLLNMAEPKKFQLAKEKLQTFSANDPGILFFDYNQDYQDQYNLFYDPIHLNGQGQRSITDRLINDLRKLKRCPLFDKS